MTTPLSLNVALQFSVFELSVYRRQTGGLQRIMRPPMRGLHNKKWH